MNDAYCGTAIVADSRCSFIPGQPDNDFELKVHVCATPCPHLDVPAAQAGSAKPIQLGRYCEPQHRPQHAGGHLHREAQQEARGRMPKRSWIMALDDV